MMHFQLTILNFCTTELHFCLLPVMGILIILLLLFFVSVVIIAFYRIDKPNPDESHEEEVRYDGPSSLDAFFLGLLGSKAIDKKLDQNRKEREKRRHDDLFWQEAARDDD